jgi:hypothetical protein
VASSEVPQDAGTTPRSLRSEPHTSRLSGRDDSNGNGDLVGGTVVLPSVAVDLLLDEHAVEYEECKRWANSEAGQSARMTNPVGFANVRAHAEAHLRALQASMPQAVGSPANVVG